jgi:uncharacterized BrkB/YihY/UPF0761 family membrane protein
MIAIFPAVAAFVSIYCLYHRRAADLREQEQLVAQLGPRNLVALAAMAGMNSLMTGLNIANERVEKRGFIGHQIVAKS